MVRAKTCEGKWPLYYGPFSVIGSTLSNTRNLEVEFDPLLVRN